MPSPKAEHALREHERQPVICPRFAGPQARLEDLERNLADFLRLGPEAHAVGVDETARRAELAVRMRMSVLLRTYQGDYHTDSFDVARLADQVRSGDELIWFWGAATEIAAFRKLMESAPVDEVPPLALGTSTTLSVEAEYGSGYAESCRNGSMDTALGGKLPYIFATHRYISGSEDAVHRRYHTITGTSRNRAGTETIRGGEAVHRLASHYLHYRFWGYVPFYVMQGGVLEQLDLVECNRDPSDVLRALRKSPPWLFRRNVEAGFASSLVEMNFDVRPPTIVDADPTATGGAQPRYRLLTPPSADLLRSNHVVIRPVRPDDDSQALPLERALRQAIESGTCCTAVHVDLTDPRGLATQDQLAEHGFALSAVVPPKDTWFERDSVRHQVNTPPIGIWVRPRPGLPVEQPYYRHQQGASPAEAAVLEYLRTRLNW